MNNFKKYGVKYVYYYGKHLMSKHNIYQKWLNIKYNKYNPIMFVRYYLYYAIKDLLTKHNQVNKYNQVNNNSDIEYIKNVMQSIITEYE